MQDGGLPNEVTAKGLFETHKIRKEPIKLNYAVYLEKSLQLLFSPTIVHEINKRKKNGLEFNEIETEYID